MVLKKHARTHSSPWRLHDWFCFHQVLIFSGSQERQDKLREMGFVDVLHKLTQALDPNLCDRYVQSTHNPSIHWIYQGFVCLFVCIFFVCLFLASFSPLSFSAKTAMQQYLAWPQQTLLLRSLPFSAFCCTRHLWFGAKALWCSKKRWWTLVMGVSSFIWC